MNNDYEQNERIKKRLEFYLAEKLPCHIILSKIMKSGSKMFLNGILTSKFNEDVYWMQEEKLGQIRVFLNEVKDIEDRIKKLPQSNDLIKDIKEATQ